MNRSNAPNVLEIRNLSVRFPRKRNWLGKTVEYVNAVRDVSLSVTQGETLGIIGESGSGKSTLASAILGFIPIHRGEVRVNGDVFESRPTPGDFRKRAEICQMIFQDPQSSLDPRFQVWQLIAEILEIRGGTTKQERFYCAAEIAERVNIPVEQLRRYPHQLSGGQRQRVAIARALASQPQLLILDEPTSALDVTIQAQVLNLLLSLQQELGLTYMFISHDVSVISHMCHRVAVMFNGRIVEAGETEEIVTEPSDPYTRKLINSVPRIGTLDRDSCAS